MHKLSYALEMVDMTANPWLYCTNDRTSTGKPGLGTLFWCSMKAWTRSFCSGERLSKGSAPWTSCLAAFFGAWKRGWPRWIVLEAVLVVKAVADATSDRSPIDTNFIVVACLLFLCLGFRMWWWMVVSSRWQRWWWWCRKENGKDLWLGS